MRRKGELRNGKEDIFRIAKQMNKKMKSGKAAGPSDIAAEMLKASGAVGIELVATLANAIVRDGRIPSN